MVFPEKINRKMNNSDLYFDKSMLSSEFLVENTFSPNELKIKSDSKFSLQFL
jgi:hypothetical protein